MTYKEIDPSTWKYDKDGDFIEGTLIQVQEEVGMNKSKLYSIETPKGVVSVWGSAVLDSRMVLVQIGSKIRITFKGRAEAKGGKNPAKLFKVEIDSE